MSTNVIINVTLVGSYKYLSPYHVNAISGMQLMKPIASFNICHVTLSKSLSNTKCLTYGKPCVAIFNFYHSDFRLLHSDFRLYHSDFRLLHSDFRLLHSDFRLLHSDFRLLHSHFFIQYSDFHLDDKEIKGRALN